MWRVRESRSQVTGESDKGNTPIYTIFLSQMDTRWFLTYSTKNYSIWRTKF